MTAGASLGALTLQAARHFADRVCLRYGSRSWTFAEFAAQARAIAAGLADRLEPGSRVGIFMANRPEYLLLQFAVELAGLVRVPLNMRFTAHEVGTIVEDCDARAVFFDGSTRDRASALAARLPRIWWCQVDGDEALHGDPWHRVAKAGGMPGDGVALDALCSINYTSGTSGKPKGVMLTHRNWLSVCRNMLADRDIRHDDVIAHIGPLTHASGTYFVPWFLRGACNVIVEGGTIEGLLETIGRERVSVFTCVPTALTRIVNHPDVDRHDLSSLRAIGYGAEPIPYNTLEKALDRFGPVLTQNYGLTEAMMTVATLGPAEHFVPDAATGRRMPRVGSIGRPYTFVEVALRDGNGERVPDGEVGEITIRSDHVMQGYWNRPEETAKVLRDGWLWTGDLARCDEQGFITLAGRSKDMLICGGFNIYPAEVEATLTSHPRVLEAAVVGTPDPDWGEIAVAFVAALPGMKLSAEELRSHCKPVLGMKTPRTFRIVGALPKNANGKVDKSKLGAAVARLEECDDV
jgi:acyl-CoA synthetase (AMP-forming)/AMP-acid ligase II